MTTKPRPKRQRRRGGTTVSRLKRLRQKIYRKELLLLFSAALLLLIGVLTRMTKPLDDSSIANTADITVRSSISKDIRGKLLAARDQIRTLEDAQAKAGVSAVPDAMVQAEISAVSLDLQGQKLKKAHKDLDHLRSHIPGWQKQVADAITQKQRQEAAQQAAAQQAQQRAAAAGTAPGQPYWQIPILIYHDTPADFESQLQTLVAKGYHAIDLDQLHSAITAGGPLPGKPVVITFDDGFSDQMTAFSLLKKYGMKATFYIINAGDASNWCIGAGRQYGLPTQPAGGCGDQYMSWDQVRELDRSGLITIGSHTLDHLSLPSLPLDQERLEIIQAKAELEAQLGHAVRHFAYPYGSYNATTIAIVQGAGFLTAVSTIPGTVQTKSNLYSLHRVRNAYLLP
ncbi:MAG: putative polysaccharide deacetylase [Patescibacteria group bacterium]|nr:putative polysaccharide deacetylase [Patescibacteria group bacterium]